MANWCIAGSRSLLLYDVSFNPQMQPMRIFHSHKTSKVKQRLS